MSTRNASTAIASPSLDWAHPEMIIVNFHFLHLFPACGSVLPSQRAGQNALSSHGRPKRPGFPRPPMRSRTQMPRMLRVIPTDQPARPGYRCSGPKGRLSWNNTVIQPDTGVYGAVGTLRGRGNQRWRVHLRSACVVSRPYTMYTNSDFGDGNRD